MEEQTNSFQDPIVDPTWNQLIQQTPGVENPGSVPTTGGSGGLTGTGGSTLSPITDNLQSTNFTTGTSGWQLKSDGTFEANTGTFRAQLIAGSIDIPDTTTANSFHVDGDGNAWWGATTLGSAVASVTKAGAATFTSGAIAGWTINATSISSTNVVIDNANEKITIGTGGDQITLDGTDGTIASNGSTWTMGGDGVLAGFTDFTPNTESSNEQWTHVVPLMSDGTVIMGFTNSSFTVPSNNIGAAGILTLTSSSTNGELGTLIPGSGSNQSYASSADLRVKARVKFGAVATDKQMTFLVAGSSNAQNDVHTATSESIRFVLNDASDVEKLYAVNASGAGNTNTDITASFNTGEWNTLLAIFNPGTDIKFYVNGTLAATHTTNLPTGAVGASNTGFGMSASGDTMDVSHMTISLEV